MRHAVGHPGIPLIGEDRLAGHRLEGRFPHEMAGRFGHHHLNVGALPGQQTHQFDRLVGGDAAGYTEHHPSVFEILHCSCSLAHTISCTIVFA